MQAADVFSLVAPREITAATEAFVRSHRFERLTLLAPENKLRLTGGLRPSGKLLAQPHHSSGFRKGQRAQQNRIHDAEDRRVGANAQRQRNYSNGRKTWPLQQTSDSVANISKQCFHDDRDIGPISPIGPIDPLPSTRISVPLTDRPSWRVAPERSRREQPLARAAATLPQMSADLPG